MVSTHSRRSLAVTSAAAAVLGLALSGCTAVVDGAAAAGDLGPCTHVAAPMVDIPASGTSEPRMRIPELPGWQRDTEIEGADDNIRLALSTPGARGTEPAAVAVMVSVMPDGAPEEVFDGFHAGMAEALEQAGLPTDVTATAGTTCGLPSEMVSFAVPVANPALGSAMNGLADQEAPTLAVVTESGGQNFLITVIQTVDSRDQEHQREAETILSGFEVLPLESSAA